MSQKINVVMAGDNNVFKGICALINSIIINTENWRNLCIWIITDEIEQLSNSINKFCCIEEDLADRININSNSIIKILNISKEVICKIEEVKTFLENKGTGNLTEGKKTTRLLSNFNFVRFYFSYLIPVNKIIYLDTDMIVKSNIEELYNLLPEEYDIGGVFPVFPYKLTKNIWIPNKKYQYLYEKNFLWNAGMFVTFLDKWRTNNYTKKCLDLIKLNKTEKIYIGCTQVPMNIIFKNIFELPLEWNQTGLGEYNRPSVVKKNQHTLGKQKNLEFEKLIKNAKLLHWTGSYKPWDIDKNDLRNYYANEWYVYFNKNNENLSLLNKNYDNEFKNSLVKSKFSNFNKWLVK